jgi:hypothetical protein
MPGSNNVAQAMDFESNAAWFVAYGIPLTPYDDTHAMHCPAAHCAGPVRLYTAPHAAADDGEAAAGGGEEGEAAAEPRLECTTCGATPGAATLLQRANPGAIEARKEAAGRLYNVQEFAAEVALAAVEPIPADHTRYVGDVSDFLNR